MRLPNWLREFFLLPPRPQKPQIRTIIAGGVKTRTKKRKRKLRENSGELDTFRPQTTGEIKRELGIGYDDILNHQDEPELTIDDRLPNGKIVVFPLFWNPLLNEMKAHGEVRISHNDHYGKLRGVDILMAARRSFKRAEIPVNVRLCGNHGYIELREGG